MDFVDLLSQHDVIRFHPWKYKFPQQIVEIAWLCLSHRPFPRRFPRLLIAVTSVIRALAEAAAHDVDAESSNVNGGRLLDG